MAGSNPALIVRVAATIEELKRNLAEGKSQIETTTAAMGKLAASFSGDKLIQAAHNVTAAVDSIGGASKLTEAEMARVNRTIEAALEKYRALGRDAPAGMQQLADATKGAANAGESWTAMLGKANTLLGALGIGVSVAGLVSFGRELLSDADALMKLHDQTGISVEGLQRFQSVGDDAGNSIDEITAAVIKMQDNLAGGNKGALAALERIGIAFVDIKNLSPEQQFVAISDAIRQIQDPSEQVNVAIDLFGKNGARVLPTLKQGFDDVSGSAVAMSAQTVKALDDVGDSLGHLQRGAKGLAAEFLSNIFFGWTRDAKAFSDQIKGVPPPLKATADAATALTLGLADTKAAEDALTDTAKKSIAVNEKMAAAMTELNSAGVGWKGTLDTIDGTIVEGIKFYLQAGVAQSALAQAYGLTDAQVKAVASSLRDEAEASKAAAAATDALVKAHAAEIAELDAATEARKRHKAELAAPQKAQTSSEVYRFDVPDIEITDDNKARYIARLKQIRENYKLFPGRQSGVNGPTGLASSDARGWSEMLNEQIEFAALTKALPGYQRGVLNAPGGLALVGERGPELVSLPRGANVYPTGSSAGGGGITIHITVNGPMLGSQQQLARLIDDTIMARQREIGTRF